MKTVEELLIDARIAIDGWLTALPTDQHAYLLIDNSALDGAWLQAQPETAALKAGPVARLLQSNAMPWQGLIGDMTQPTHSAAAPLLVRLNRQASHQYVLDQILRDGLLHNALHWLASPQPLPVLAVRLQQRLRIQLGTQEMVLRYFDSRFLHEWLALLSPAQQTGFLSATNSWCYLNRDGELTTLPVQFDDTEALTFPFVTNTQQRAGLRQLGLADRVQTVWESLNHEQLLPDLRPSQRHQWLCARINDARRYAIDTAQALAVYCNLALTEGEAFHQQPAWQNKLALLKSSSVASETLE